MKESASGMVSKLCESQSVTAREHILSVSAREHILSVSAREHILSVSAREHILSVSAREHILVAMRSSRLGCDVSIHVCAGRF